AKATTYISFGGNFGTIAIYLIAPAIIMLASWRQVFCLRGKRNLASVLDDIPGVGEKRKKNLLKHFGSFTKIKEASVEELMEVEGIHAAVAEEIYSYLRTHQDLQARLDARKKL
ncbi:MAG: hypothetical protein J6A39_06540, partial [Peptococcaceae bacterium]|nr:hypothetical protein [Peptococcaceae bacterium]